MAVPVVTIAVNTARVIHKASKLIPGGYKTMIAVGAIISVVIPLMLVNAIASSFKSTGVTNSVICDSSLSQGATNDESEAGAEGGAPSASFSGAGYVPGEKDLPFPTESSTKLYIPVKGVALSAVSGYGPRTPIKFAGGYTPSWHDGADFAAPLGTPIYAMADGVVTMAKKNAHDKGGEDEGSIIQIRHLFKGQEYTTSYRHIQGPSIKVKVGDTVKGGQRIASVGMEGRATGPHLHFVVAKGKYQPYQWTPIGPTINPVEFLKSNGAVANGGGSDGGGTGGAAADGTTTDDGSGNGDSCSGDSTSTTLDTLSGDGTTKWNSTDNGKFGDADLASVGKVKLYSDAASQLKLMIDAYNSDKSNKSKLTIKYGYRSLDEQKKMNKAGTQDEKPGESIFGFARIVQFSFANKASSEGYKWLSEHASEYGFEQPNDYAKGGSLEDFRIWSYKGGVGMSVAISGGASAKKAQEYAKTAMQDKYQWGDSEYQCLLKMWTKESSWNYKAANGISSARGIPQAMMSLHFGYQATGKAWDDPSNAKAQEFLNSVSLQVDWGLKYIKDVYHTPCEAWAYWQVHSHY